MNVDVAFHERLMLLLCLWQVAITQVSFPSVSVVGSISMINECKKLLLLWEVSLPLKCNSASENKFEGCYLKKVRGVHRFWLESRQTPYRIQLLHSDECDSSQSSFLSLLWRKNPMRNLYLTQQDTLPESSNLHKWSFCLVFQKFNTLC